MVRKVGLDDRFGYKNLGINPKIIVHLGTMANDDRWYDKNLASIPITLKESCGLIKSCKLVRTCYFECHESC